MAYGPNTVAAGTTGELPDIPVYGDTVGGAVIQGVKELDPTAGSSTPIGTDANPKKVKNRRRGNGDYDSGRVAATTALTSVTSATIHPEDGFITNLTNADQWLKITDGSDVAHSEQLPLAPYETRPWPFTITMAGLKVQASANSAVVIGVRGGQTS